MTDKTELTTEEALAALLIEARRISNRVQTIANWMVFLGVLVVIGLIVTACNALMGL